MGSKITKTYTATLEDSASFRGCQKLQSEAVDSSAVISTKATSDNKDIVLLRLQQLQKHFLSKLKVLQLCVNTTAATEKWMKRVTKELEELEDAPPLREYLLSTRCLSLY